MRSIDPKNTPTRDLHQFLLGCVSPRPIAFASTIDNDGNPNLAPYSFFNAFSSNPPILVFSSNRRVVDNTTKDTLANIEANGEVVINMVNYEIVRQMTIASISFPTGVSEFTKAGLTPIPSDIVKPFRVKESPAHIECKVREIITLGDKGGAGHLILCDVVKMHISEDVIDDNRINPHKIDLMGRMGRSYYCRASGDAIQTIVQPVMQVTIGYDQLPERIKSSTVLTANDVAMLSGLKALPTEGEIQAFKETDAKLKAVLKGENAWEEQQEYARELLGKEQRVEAVKVLLVEE